VTGLIRKLKRRIGTKPGLLIRSVDDEVNRLTPPDFANEPVTSISPRRIFNAKCIWIGDDVSLGPAACSVRLEHTRGPSCEFQAR
jgi:hypothetical protein